MSAGRPRNLVELLARRVERTPDLVAWTFGAERSTWRQVDDEARALALELIELGVAPGDTVAVLAQTTPQWAIADLGVLRAGGVSVGIYPTLTAEQVAFELRDAGARVAFAGSMADLRLLEEARALGAPVEVVVAWGDAEKEAGVGFDDALRRRRGEVRRRAAALCARAAARSPDDPAVVIYTSGTTGRPKGALLSHRNCVAEACMLAELVPLDPRRDCTVSLLPMAHAVEHVMGLYGRLATGVRTRYVGSMDAEAIFAAVRLERPTIFGAVPRVFEKAHARILERVDAAPPWRRRVFEWALGVGAAHAEREHAGLDTGRGGKAWAHALADRLVLRRLRAAFGGRVRFFLCGAAPIAKEILELFHAAGMLVLEGYGMTECAGLAVGNRAEAYRLGTVGRPLPGVELRLAEDGEILLRGETVFSGYLGLPQATREARDAEGWLHTGDIGELDEGGWLRLTDRKKNLLVTAGGKNVAPAAIERLLGREPLLGPAVVVGEGRPFIAALLTLDRAEARHLVGDRSAGAAALARHPQVVARVRAAVERANRELARYERIRRYMVLEDELRIERGELTPTLKPRRKVVVERYAGEVEALYAQRPDRRVVDVEPAAGAGG